MNNSGHEDINPKRKALLERLKPFKIVPGSVSIENKTDDQLELYIELLESMSERGKES